MRQRVVPDKDFHDLILLLDSSDPAQTRAIFDHYQTDPIVRQAVETGAWFVSILIRDPVVAERAHDVSDRMMPPGVLNDLLAKWRP